MMAWRRDPLAHLQLNRELRQEARVCFRCEGEIEGSPGVERRGYYHPLSRGCP